MIEHNKTARWWEVVERSKDIDFCIKEEARGKRTVETPSGRCGKNFIQLPGGDVLCRKKDNKKGETNPSGSKQQSER